MPLKSYLENEILQSFPQYEGRIGFTKLDRPLSFDKYLHWIEQGYQADMDFLVKHIPAKENPQTMLATARSAIVIRFPYIPHPKPKDLGFHSELVKVANYAKGEDYHYWLKSNLESIIDKLKEKWPEESFLSFTDSSPVLERDLAYRAGLGWVGKNTCLIDQGEGSFFLIGEIYTSLDLAMESSLHADRCGNCTKCIDACPTNALTERNLDSNKCISYWTIEAKQSAPKTLLTNFSGWYFGCDICQQVCPWNVKWAKSQDLDIEGISDKELLDPTQRETLVSDLQGILSSSNKQLQKRFLGTALNRASGNSHKRNAIVLALNYSLIELSPLLVHISKTSENEMLREFAGFSIGELEKFRGV